MPTRILCPECETAFAYSPALLGRTVRCRQCHHSFTITSPPEDPGASPAPPPGSAVMTSAPPAPKALVPPPLPPTVLPEERTIPRARSRRDEHLDDDRPRRRDRDHDDFRERRRGRSADSKPATGVLITLIAGFVFLCLVLGAGVTYLLWPSSDAIAPTAQGPTSPADAPATALDPPKNLDQIMKDGPDRPGAPAVPPMPAPGPFIPPPAFPEMPALPPGLPPPPPRPAAPARPKRPADWPNVPAVRTAPAFLPISPLSIQPSSLNAEREERNLAGQVENAVAAGGGRYVLLHMPRKKLVAVVDVNTGKIAKHIEANDERAWVAGGMNLFVIYLPGKNVLERYNCTTLEREAELKAAFDEEVLGLAMGSASNGPLVAALAGARRAGLGSGATLCYFDPMTGKEIQYEVVVARERNPFGLGNHNLRDLTIRVSANGQVATGWSAGGSIQSEIIEGGRINHYWKLGGAETLVPSADGQVLFDRSRRLNVELVGDPEGRPGRQEETWLIPAIHGDFHVVLQGVGGRGRTFQAQPASADIQYGLEGKSLLKIPELRDFEIPGGFEGRGKTFDRNLFLVPDAKVLAVVPSKKRDQLVLYRIDIDKALAKLDFDYLLVTSRPMTVAFKGQKYRYTLVVKSKKGGIKVTLDNAPRGMTATPSGTVEWDVPKDFAEPDVGVLLRVSDASGKDVFHSYRLTVTGKVEKPSEPKK